MATKAKTVAPKKRASNAVDLHLERAAKQLAETRKINVDIDPALKRVDEAVEKLQRLSRRAKASSRNGR